MKPAPNYNKKTLLTLKVRSAAKISTRTGSNLSTVGEFVKMLQQHPQDKDILFEDGEGQLFGLFTVQKTASPCHITVELTKLDKDATLKECQDG